MIAITLYSSNEEQNDDKVMLYSIDNDKKSLTLKQSFSVSSSSSIQFTPDGKYTSYTNRNGSLAFWDITKEREIMDQIYISYIKNEIKCSLLYFSPASCGQRIVVHDSTIGDDEGDYIASYWISKM
jgi:hypothetical protein